MNRSQSEDDLRLALLLLLSGILMLATALRL